MSSRAQRLMDTVLAKVQSLGGRIEEQGATGFVAVFGLEPVEIFADGGGGHFLGFPVRPVSELPGADVDGIVVATFERPERHLAELARMGIPPQKFLTLRRLATPASNGEGGRAARRS